MSAPARIFALWPGQGVSRGVPREDEIEELFTRVGRGDHTARVELFPLLYDELRRLARGFMGAQRPSHTLQATALVNEAYLRLCRPAAGDWNGRTHFFRLASTAMRQILVDHARRAEAVKREVPGQRMELDELHELVEEYDRRSGGLLALDAALDRLQQRDPTLVRLVELRFFGGRSIAEIAEVLEVSERQVSRWWQAARLFLKDELERGEEPG